MAQKVFLWVGPDVCPGAQTYNVIQRACLDEDLRLLFVYLLLYLLFLPLFMFLCLLPIFLFRLIIPGFRILLILHSHAKGITVLKDLVNRLPSHLFSEPRSGMATWNRIGGGAEKWLTLHGIFFVCSVFECKIVVTDWCLKSWWFWNAFSVLTYLTCSWLWLPFSSSCLANELYSLSRRAPRE